jgi:hypothetical protein
VAATPRWTFRRRERLPGPARYGPPALVDVVNETRLLALVAALLERDPAARPASAEVVPAALADITAVLVGLGAAADAPRRRSGSARS